MDIKGMSSKEVGNHGERAVARYLKQRGFRIVDRNVSRKTGEIDVIARKGRTMHFVEVKTVFCSDFPDDRSVNHWYDPSANLHAKKIRKVVRTSEWYMAEKRWKGEAQIDGALVWLRSRDMAVRIRYLPQIL